MSSYLTFYGIPKVCDEKNTENAEAKPIAIVSFSRNNDIYRYFDDNCDIAFCYEGVKYTDITQFDVDKVEKDITDDIRSSEKRLNEYEKYVGSNPDYVSEILSIKEYLEDLYRALHYAEFINHIVTDADFKYSSGFAKIVANIS